MKSQQLLEKLEFHESVPFAQPLLVNKDGRILRWMLTPGQSITEHSIHHSPFYVVVKGHGMFAAQGEPAQEFGPNSLIVFDPDEMHSVRALDEELIFIGFLQGVAGARPNYSAGEMAEAQTKEPTVTP